MLILGARAASTAAGVVALVGCRVGDGAGSVDGPLVDERTGAYRGVQMGDSIGEVREVLGRDEGGSGFAPAGELPADVGVPQSIPAPGSLQPGILRYQDVALLIGPRGVYAFIVGAEGARSARGVAIGDDMDEAHEAYELRCIDVAGGESPFGVMTYPSCSATIDGRIRIWFGEDPIRSITLLSLPHARD